MTQLKIKIVKHEDKTAKTGTDYSRFQGQDGQWYSCFDGLLITELKKLEAFGDIVVVDVAENGNYKNITFIQGIEASTEESFPVVKPGELVPIGVPGVMKEKPSVQTYINKMACLKASVELLKDKETTTIDDVKSQADVLFDWLNK